jgi:Uma2 family endonuclease
VRFGLRGAGGGARSSLQARARWSRRLAPDWVAEILSPSTRALERGAKLRVYAEHGVPHVWLVEPLDKLIEVLRLDGATYRIVQTAVGDAPARLEPFDAIELDTAALWQR